MANWRIQIKSPIFYLANVFCTCLTQNLARDPSAVAIIQSLKNALRPCLQLLILLEDDNKYSDDGNAEIATRQTGSAPNSSNEQSILSQQNIEEAQK